MNMSVKEHKIKVKVNEEPVKEKRTKFGGEIKSIQIQPTTVAKKNIEILEECKKNK